MRFFITTFLATSLAATAMAGAPGSKLRFSHLERSRRQECGVKGVDWGQGIGPPPAGCGPTADGGGGGGGGTPRSTSAHAAAMLGDVGLTTVAVSDADRAAGKFGDGQAQAGTGGIGENIYGPFEAGFSGSGAQKSNIAALGCSDPSKVELPGGVDTAVAEEIMGAACDMELPRTENGKFISLLDECGGHTREYHFHEKLICLFDAKADGHSTKVGEAADDKKTPIYGKYEKVVDGVHIAPLLDACGGHFGITPDSDGKVIYHYHVQDKAPFVVGCFGPNDDGGLVTVAQCRSYYTGCGDGDEVTFPLKDGKSVTYDLWCPCFDADGSTMGTKELPIFSTTDTKVTADPTTAGDKVTADPTTAGDKVTAAPTTVDPAAAVDAVVALLEKQYKDASCTDAPDAGQCPQLKASLDAAKDAQNSAAAACVLSSGAAVALAVVAAAAL